MFTEFTNFRSIFIKQTIHFKSTLKPEISQQIKQTMSNPKSQHQLYVYNLDYAWKHYILAIDRCGNSHSWNFPQIERHHEKMKMPLCLLSKSHSVIFMVIFQFCTWKYLRNYYFWARNILWILGNEPNGYRCKSNFKPKTNSKNDSLDYFGFFFIGNLPLGRKFDPSRTVVNPTTPFGVWNSELSSKTQAVVDHWFFKEVNWNFSNILKLSSVSSEV